MQKQNQGSLTIAEFTKKYGSTLSPVVVPQALIARWAKQGEVGDDVYQDLLSGYVAIVGGFYAYMSQFVPIYTPLSKIVV